MRLLFIAITSLSFSFLNAQTSIDQRKGFGEFILGDSFSKWESRAIRLSNTRAEKVLTGNNLYNSGIVKAVNLNNDNTSYLYSGECCQSVFGYNVDDIILQFRNSKLDKIVVITERFQKGFNDSGSYAEWRTDDYYSINRSLIAKFGQNTDYRETSGDGMETLWVGNSVRLRAIYNYMGVNFGDKLFIVIEWYDDGF